MGTVTNRSSLYRVMILLTSTTYCLRCKYPIHHKIVLLAYTTHARMHMHSVGFGCVVLRVRPRFMKCMLYDL